MIATVAGTAWNMNNQRHPRRSMIGPPATTAMTGDMASTAV
jgi:hypothetical protein